MADRVLAGGAVRRAEALGILRAADLDTPAILEAGQRIRAAHFGNRVQLYVLMNAKSGFCPEDCHYCSQSSGSTADIDRYGLRSQDEILDAAGRARTAGASTFCMVASGRGPSDRQVDSLCEASRAIKEQLGLHVCACLGLLRDGQAELLRAAGVDRYNHNLNTSARFSPSIVTTHSYEDRVATIRRVAGAGMGVCAGGIFGMGEGEEDRVDLAFALRDLRAESIPCNFLHAVPGTPREGTPRLGAMACLRILAMMRFVNPEREIRVAGGREVQLGSHQGTALKVANSIFVNGYLTTPGQGAAADRALIEQHGFVVDRTPPRGG